MNLSQKNLTEVVHDSPVKFPSCYNHNIYEFNLERARQTQIEFLEQCPIVSQETSLYHHLDGDDHAGRQTQLNFLKNLGEVANNTPVLGHLKGGVH